MNDALVAGCAVPSSRHPVDDVGAVDGDDVLMVLVLLEPIVLRDEQRTPVLLAAAVSSTWCCRSGGRRCWRRRCRAGAEPATGALAGLGIAVLDLGVIGCCVPAIRAPAQLLQWVYHLVFGLAVGVVLRCD